MADTNNRGATLRKILLRVRRYWPAMILSLAMAAVHVAMTLYIPILVGNAIDKKLNESELTKTGIRLDGFPIPYWEEVKKMVLEAALVNDEIHLVGWDVAIGKDGPLVVEGNRSSSFDIIQVPPKKGQRPLLDNLIAEIKAGKMN